MCETYYSPVFISYHIKRVYKDKYVSAVVNSKTWILSSAAADASESYRLSSNKYKAQAEHAVLFPLAANSSRVENAS